MEPQVQWTAPAALWGALAGNGPVSEGAAGAGTTPAAAGAPLRAPALLRFASDAFMPEYLSVLENQPERLAEWVARPEKWQAPLATPVPVEQLPPLVRKLERLRLATASPLTGAAPPRISVPTATGRLKLFQPGHMRFYLVTASLVCRQPGLPDRRIDPGAGEKVGYVVRRLRLKAAAAAVVQATGVFPEFSLDNCDEYAFVDGKYWVQASADDLVAGEEVNPLFGVNYADTTGARPGRSPFAQPEVGLAGSAALTTLTPAPLPRRRALSGVIPVGKRETYMAATIGRPDDGPEAGATPLMDPRKAHLQKTVTEAWRRIIASVDQAAVNAGRPSPAGQPGDDGSKAGEQAKAQAAARSMSTWLSWLVLIDLGDFLSQYVKPVWAVITGAAAVSSLTTGTPARALYDALAGATYQDSALGDPLRSLVWALNEIRPYKDGLEATKLEYTEPAPPATPVRATLPFPPFRFPLHETNLRALMEASAGHTLDDLVTAALDPNPDMLPPLPLAAAMSGLELNEPGWFIIRCVFERPNCVPITAPLLSAPTQPFQMAAFFDAEAPARPIRINLPMDTTPAGLRKFDRNTAFMISDALCGQMKRMGSLTLADLVLSVLPWPLHRDLPVGALQACDEGGDPSGMICSLSIPIITICALILLMIIVTLLDFIFRWLPFFILCFPAKLFGSKEANA